LATIVSFILLQPALPPTSDTAAAKPLPDNKPCAYPAAAQQLAVTGAVHFTARVTSEGAPDSIQIGKVPAPGLGFEEAVHDCVAQWRFEPAPVETGLRSYQGKVRFRLAPKEEVAVRELVERLASAWNNGDGTALEDLEARGDEAAHVSEGRQRSLREQLQAAAGVDACRMELDPDLPYLRFLARDLAHLKQPFRCSPSPAESAAERSTAVLELAVAKGGRGWRFVTLSDSERARLSAVRVGSGLKEPKKLKDVPPVYPDVARQARVEGQITLDCVISGEGRITDVRILRGVPLLDQAAIDAVEQWVYAPTLVEGRPVPVAMIITISFTLR
jgi:TonB family protein